MSKESDLETPTILRSRPDRVIGWYPLVQQVCWGRKEADSNAANFSVSVSRLGGGGGGCL